MTDAASDPSLGRHQLEDEQDARRGAALSPRRWPAFVAGLDHRIQPFVIPPFTAVREVKRSAADTRVKVGAQNMHWADAGAWTGEISPPMLSDCGLDLVELGHSASGASISARPTRRSA